MAFLFVMHLPPWVLFVTESLGATVGASTCEISMAD